LSHEAQHVEDPDTLNRQAAAWLERRDFGDWTDRDRADLDAWLCESSAKRVAFLRADSRWKRTEMLGALRPFRVADISHSLSRTALRTFAKFGITAAALAILGTAAVNYFLTPGDTVYATPIGGHKTVALADGSRIELNTNTILRIGSNANRRVVSLVAGEAYFQIRHDVAHPFIVTAGVHRVTDLGTEFLIRHDADKVKVALIEGRASIQSTDISVRAHSRVLMPGDVVIATANSMSLTRRPAQELAHELSWRRGILIFDNTTLVDAANELNRYNRRKVVIADPAVARLTIVGTFPENDVEAVADAAREVFGLRVENRGDEVVISR
jgi:transmembrane sensor